MSFTFYKKLIKIYKSFNNVKGVGSVKYTTIVVIGDKNGGLGVGKSSNINQKVSILKSLNNAKRNYFKIFLKNGTIPHAITGKSGNCVLKIIPINKNSNFSCGSYLRSILDIIGIYNITSKIYGSKNFYNILTSTLNALKSLKSSFFLIRKKNVY